MFGKQLPHLLEIEELLKAFEKIETKAVGIDETSLQEFQSNLTTNLQALKNSIIEGTYLPEPNLKIEIKKENSKELRPIGISSIKDKIVQNIIAQELSIYFDKIFSDKSYAYRAGKNIYRAINRCTDFLNRKNHWIVKTDIDNFFEEIDHNKLISMLNLHISDKRVLKLIELLLKNGSFKKQDYIPHFEGVHQGDSLSPLLSNIYLDSMDKFLEKNEIEFVRYADDFVLFLTKEDRAKRIKEELSQFLKTLNLKLEEEKTYIRHINDGFSFLGVRFEGSFRKIENESFQKIISKIHSYAKTELPFEEKLKKLQFFIELTDKRLSQILKNESYQASIIKEATLESLSKMVFISKTNSEITTKERFRELLQLSAFADITQGAINKAYLLLESKENRDITPKLDKKKREYSKELESESVITIFRDGVFLGISKNKITIKERGKMVKSYPKNAVQRILIAKESTTLSTSLIKECADLHIPIDFIDYRGSHFATFLSHKSAMPKNALLQLKILYENNHHHLMKEFVEGKAKNQINYLKNLSRHHKEISKVSIKNMETILKKAKKVAKTNLEFMGYEGEISSIYWGEIKKIVPEEFGFLHRHTKGAKDTINSALNYGYAILYAKVQSSLHRASLALNISFLHALDDTKPTLVYDMVEEFRTFIVDRTIISMANLGEPLAVNKSGLLTDESKKAISQNIYEKLGNFTKHKKESKKISNIIQEQAYLLARHIRGEEKYNSFIAKY